MPKSREEKKKKNNKKEMKFIFSIIKIFMNCDNSYYYKENEKYIKTL